MKSEIKINDRCFKFSLRIIEIYKHLQSKKEYILSKQLLRSGTSIGANVEEAQAAQSKKDFISKMSIASKEARESNYWIRLLEHSNYLNDYNKKEELSIEIKSIVNILTKIVKTATQNLQPNT